MLNRQTCVLELRKGSGIGPEEIELNDTRWMHARNVKNCHIGICSGFRIYVTTFSDNFITIITNTTFKTVSMEILTEISINEIGLRIPVHSKYNPSGVLLSCIVD